MEIYSANLTVQVSKKTCKAGMLHQLHPDVYGHSTDLYAYCYVERWSVWHLFQLSVRSVCLINYDQIVQKTYLVGCESWSRHELCTE